MLHYLLHIFFLEKVSNHICNLSLIIYNIFYPSFRSLSKFSKIEYESFHKISSNVGGGGRVLHRFGTIFSYSTVTMQSKYIFYKFFLLTFKSLFFSPKKFSLSKEVVFRLGNAFIHIFVCQNLHISAVKFCAGHKKIAPEIVRADQQTQFEKNGSKMIILLLKNTTFLVSGTLRHMKKSRTEFGLKTTCRALNLTHIGYASTNF